MALSATMTITIRPPRHQITPTRHRRVRRKIPPTTLLQLSALERVHVLEHEPVANAVLENMSVRQLWLMRRVCRTFRDIATHQLRGMMRPIVGGGVPCGLSSATMEMLDLATMGWCHHLTLPTCRTDSAACLVDNGELLVVGGDTTPEHDNAELRGWSVTPTVLKLDPRSLTWSENMPPMDYERTTFRLVKCPSGRIMAIGGCDDDEDQVTAVEALDEGADSWITLAPMKRGRHSFAAGCLPSGQVVVAGGQDHYGKFMSAAEVYDPALNKWNPLPDVPSQCRAASTGWIREADGRFCVCGLGERGTTLRNCYALASDLSRWELVWEVDFPHRTHDTGGSSSGACFPVRGGCLRIGGTGVRADGDDDEDDDDDEETSLACGDLYDEATGKVYRLPHDMLHRRRWIFGGLIPGPEPCS